MLLYLEIYNLLLYVCNNVLLGSVDYQAPVYQFQMQPKREEFSEDSVVARETVRYTNLQSLAQTDLSCFS